MSAKIEQEILSLREKVNHHNHLYYVLGKSEITDQQFDRMLDRLQELEDKHPEYDDPNSPTRRVGGSVLDNFKTVKHNVAMLSVDKSYNAKDIKDWLTRIGKILPGQKFRFYVDPKLDGVAAGLRYEKGKLVLGVTRGDGVQGDDITNNLRTVGSVPLTLKSDKKNPIPDVLEVRGEVYMTHGVFAGINEQIAKEGGDLYKNPRNLTAGTLKSLDSKVVASRKLSFSMHGTGEIKGAKWETHTDFVKSATTWGLPQSPLSKVCNTVEEVMTYLTDFEKTRRTLDYDTDGVVIRVDNYSQQTKLGRTAKAPRWAIAFKYATEQAETVIHSVDFFVGKQGAITPRANMNPVELAGTTVSHASLHNFDEIARKDIRLGDHVIVEKAGEIIPYVVCSLPEKRTGKETQLLPPEKCPNCDAATTRKEGEAVLRCTNIRCSERVSRSLEHFASRRAMDIEGLGTKLIDQLVSKELVSSFVDLYTLTEEQVTKLERMGKKSAKNVIAAIENSKTRGLGKFLYALCITHVGQTVAKLLADTYGSLDKLAEQTEEKLAEVDGIGDVMAEEIVAWFEDEENQQLIAALKEQGILMEKATVEVGPVTQEGEGELKSDVLKGMSVVVTGKLTKRSRDEVHALIEAAGGKASKSISKKTHLLVAGEKAGSKLAKAEKLGVKVISEQDLYDQLGLSGTSAPAAEENQEAAAEVAETKPESKEKPAKAESKPKAEKTEKKPAKKAKETAKKTEGATGKAEEAKEEGQQSLF